MSYSGGVRWGWANAGPAANTRMQSKCTRAREVMRGRVNQDEWQAPAVPRTKLFAYLLVLRDVIVLVPLFAHVVEFFHLLVQHAEKTAAVFRKWLNTVHVRHVMREGADRIDGILRGVFDSQFVEILAGNRKLFFAVRGQDHLLVIVILLALGKLQEYAKDISGARFTRNIAEVKNDR